MPDQTEEISDGTLIPELGDNLPLVEDTIIDGFPAVVFQDANPTGVPKDLEFTATIISTYGGDQSNSYIDLQSAHNFIMTSIVDPTAWSSADWRARTAALLEATRDIDSVQYAGTKTTPNQILQFPRTYQTSWPYSLALLNQNFMSLSQIEAKRNVERATCWQALHILRLQGIDQTSEAISSGVRQRTRTIGSTSDNVSYSRDLNILCYEAKSLLTMYKTSRRVINRGG